MRLEMAEFPVSEIRLGTKFGYDSGKLLVDNNAIVDSVLREKRIEAAWLDVVAPGDQRQRSGLSRRAWSRRTGGRWANAPTIRHGGVRRSGI